MAESAGIAQASAQPRIGDVLAQGRLQQTACGALALGARMAAASAQCIKKAVIQQIG